MRIILAMTLGAVFFIMTPLLKADEVLPVDSKVVAPSTDVMPPVDTTDPILISNGEEDPVSDGGGETLTQ